MIPLLIRLLTFILVVYLLYLASRLISKKSWFSPGKSNWVKREKTDYDKDEWEKIKQSLDYKDEEK